MSRAALRADPSAGIIWYGNDALLSGIPEAAWRYRLGNKSALEHVLDQYRERQPKDPTIRARFNTYRLADHLQELSLLLARVATVSVQTMELTDALAAASPLNPANHPPGWKGPKAAKPAKAPRPAKAPQPVQLNFFQP